MARAAQEGAPPRLARDRAVVDRSYPLEEVVEATAYVETGQKTGNVVLVVA